MDIEDIEALIGIDVGKVEHWTTALNWDGKKVFEGPCQAPGFVEAGLSGSGGCRL